LIISRSLTPLNSSRTSRAVRRTCAGPRCNDNSRQKVQNVRGDSSDRAARARVGDPQLGIEEVSLDDPDLPF
jgi:hypothetical protein